MSIADRWLLPDGVKEILPPESGQLESLRRTLLDLFHSWGYDLVMPPTVEYLDSLLTGTGNDLDLATYKVTDQLTGRLMGIRADTTPQVARIDAHSLPRKTAARYCYCNSVLHTLPANMLAGRSPMQIGAELYGHSGVASDIEMVCLMLETLLTAGIKGPITIDIGHVAFYRALLKEADLSEDQQYKLYELLQGKRLTELDAFLELSPLSSERRSQFQQLLHLSGGIEVLDQAEALMGGLSADTDKALAELRELADAVNVRYPSVKLFFDASELRGYNYHTGLVYAAYVPQYGQPIAKGGRYDEVGKEFGRARPATGFSADIKVICEVSEHSGQEIESIYAPVDADPQLAIRVTELRATGERVLQGLPGDDADPQSLGCSHQLALVEGRWQVTDL